MQEVSRPLRLAQVAVAIGFIAASLAPIRSYDYFWHLATGRWITEHHSLPLTDPFTVASDQSPWINGEWLFQVPAYAIQQLGGHALLSTLRGLLVGLLFFALWRRAWQQQCDLTGSDELFAFGSTLLFVALCLLGSIGRLDLRPSTVAAAFTVVAIVLLGRRPAWARDLTYAALTIVWINTHPTALLAPVLALIVVLLQQLQERRWVLAGSSRIVGMSAFALLINPFGWRAIAAPLELTRFEQTGGFVNAEWLPSTPRQFPLLYVVLVIAGLMFLAAWQRREHWRVALFVLFALLAVRSVRNQGLLFAVAPLLIPAIPRPSGFRRIGPALIAVAVGVVAWTIGMKEHSVGVDDARLPVTAVDLLRSSGLQGNVYNPDQFGGILIWRLYPERRALTDGRNELYRSYIGEYARARLDGRAWNSMLQKYSVTLAIDEFHGEKMDRVDAVTGRHEAMPASLLYFPRTRWAMIAFDDAAMVFARRDSYPPEVLAHLEYKVLVPDAAQTFNTATARAAAREELDRLRKEIGERAIVAKMKEEIR